MKFFSYKNRLFIFIVIFCVGVVGKYVGIQGDAKKALCYFAIAMAGAVLFVVLEMKRIKGVRVEWH